MEAVSSYCQVRKVLQLVSFIALAFIEVVQHHLLDVRSSAVIFTDASSILLNVQRCRQRAPGYYGWSQLRWRG